jgi:hypothetical protein
MTCRTAWPVHMSSLLPAIRPGIPYRMTREKPKALVLLLMAFRTACPGIACSTASYCQLRWGGGGGGGLQWYPTIRHHLDHESGALVNFVASLVGPCEEIRFWGGLCLVLVLVVVLPMAPMGPLRKCLCIVVLSTSPSHHHFRSSSGGRYQSGCIVFVAIFETVHGFHILHMGRQLVPTVYDPVSSYFKPGRHLTVYLRSALLYTINIIQPRF